MRTSVVVFSHSVFGHGRLVRGSPDLLPLRCRGIMRFGGGEGANRLSFPAMPPRRLPARRPTRRPRRPSTSRCCSSSSPSAASTWWPRRCSRTWRRWRWRAPGGGRDADPARPRLAARPRPARAARPAHARPPRRLWGVRQPDPLHHRPEAHDGHQRLHPDALAPGVRGGGGGRAGHRADRPAAGWSGSSSRWPAPWCWSTRCASRPTRERPSATC